MQQRLVVWGDIGTDHKALITIELFEEKGNVIFHAFPEEIMTQNIQDELFTVWKNGGEYTFPEEALIWEVPSNKENLLPEEIKLHKPGVLVNAQRIWQKKVMLKNNYNLFEEKLNVLQLELDSLKEFRKPLWDRTKSLWEEILKYTKKGLLFKQDTDSLKIRIDNLFEGLKAFKRINHEKGFEESNSLNKLFNLRIDECIEKLVYPDEWNKIFEQLKVIQKEMNDGHLSYKHKRLLFNKINGVFKDLRSYKNANYLNHIQDRIKGLYKVVSGMEKDIEQDAENYDTQCNKMLHYTRGKMTDEEIKEQFKYLLDRIASKQKKVEGILRTVQGLEKKVERIENEPDEPQKNRKRSKKKKAKPAKPNEAQAQPNTPKEAKPAEPKTEKVKQSPPQPTKEKVEKKPIEVAPPKATEKVKEEKPTEIVPPKVDDAIAPEQPQAEIKTEETETKPEGNSTDLA